jgi:hypothetical protein
VGGSYLQDLIEDMTREGVKFIIAGGVAVVLHGVSRATMDIDAAVAMDDTNLQRLLRVLKRQNMVPRAPVPAETILDPAKRRAMVEDKGALVFTFIDNQKPYKQLDIFLTEDLSYEALKNDVDIFQIGDSSVSVLSKKKLIDLKRKVNPPRNKDLLDIDELSKLED